MSVEPPEAVEISPLRDKETGSAAGLLASCFANDPLACWLFPDRRRRLRLLRSLFLRLVHDAYPFGSVDGARKSGALVGVAVSLPPGAFPPSTARNLRMAPTIALAATIYPTALGRAHSVLEADTAAHLAGPHWYAEAIAVHPAARTTGIGTKLLQQILDRAAHDQLPTFLVTSNPSNLPWYENHGFSGQNEIRARPDAPPFWPMVRLPTPRHSNT